LFDVGDDSRSNHFEERGDDEDQPNTNHNHANDPLRCQLSQLEELGQRSLNKIEWACTKHMEQDRPREAWDIEGA